MDDNPDTWTVTLMPDRWLVGLVACALQVEADAVLAALRGRRLHARSVPTGPARQAWTCAAGGATLGVIVTGRGAVAAAGAAGFWAPRTRCVLLCAALTATEAVESPTLACDGDAGVVDAVAAHARRAGVALRTGRVATVAESPLGNSARRSLAGAGYVAAAPEADVWRAAATAVGAGFAVCAGLVDAAEAPRPVPDGRAGPPWWQGPVRLVGRGDRAEAARREATLRDAADAAAGAVLDALLGPPATRSG